MPRKETIEVKQEALRLGFSAIGISTAGVLTGERSHFEEWLDRGFHAGMGWMAQTPERRTNPELVFPGVRSVISVALNYYTPGDQSPDPETGKISRYAWGNDYHDVMEKKIRELEDFLIRSIPEARTRGYVDTGPVMDKAWAAKGGVGWLGKHTNVITRGWGSWVFLGTILTTAVLDQDDPETDMCGSCTACLDACPTGALPEPYLLDANKCISYLTIEHREKIPRDLAEVFDRWVFGCDICQDVCPWNRFQRPTAEPEFLPRDGVRSLRLTDLADMSQEEFAVRFRGSAIKRTKVSGLTRNARAVLESSS
jgi:epoxyqueuosine reductase